MTDNKSKYFFDDFTADNYKNILIKLKDLGFDFKTFCTFDGLINSSKIVILRHDVDFSVNRALRLAKIEHDLSIVSTYFLHIHNDFYNLLQKSTFDKCIEIINMDHKIGLHFDSHFYNIDNEKDLELKLSFEKEVLVKIFSKKIKVFSFHNTNDFTLSCKNELYSGMINVYSTKFFEGFTYCSDTNGYWRFKRLEDILISDKVKLLHLLIHPAWWQDEVMSPYERVKRCVDGRAQYTIKSYIEILSEAGRKNIDW